MNLKIFKNRNVYKDYAFEEGTQNENNATLLQFEFEEDINFINKRIVFITEDGNLWDLINEDNTYKIKNSITKYKNVKAYVWLTSEDNIDFRTKEFDLDFYDNENADDLQPTEEQIDGFNTLITKLNLKIQEVNLLKENLIELEKELRANDELRDEKVNQAIKKIEDLTNKYDDNAKEKIEEFNKNAINKTTEFNDNAKEKTDDLNKIAIDIKNMANALVFATFNIDVDNGELYISTADSLGNMGFEVNDDGDLILNIEEVA